MTVYIWWKEKKIASVTTKPNLVINKAKRDGIKSNENVEVWENEKQVDVYYTKEELLRSFAPMSDEDEEDNKTFW